VVASVFRKLLEEEGQLNSPGQERLLTQ